MVLGLNLSSCWAVSAEAFLRFLGLLGAAGLHGRGAAGRLGGRRLELGLRLGPIGRGRRGLEAPGFDRGRDLLRAAGLKNEMTSSSFTVSME